MTKKALPDRRIQRTRQLLLGSLIELISEKGYEAITVQDIIDRANVGRSTFYSHFQDKEHLLLSGSEKMAELFDDFRAPASSEDKNWSFSLALFRHVEEQRKAFKALLGKHVRNVMVDRIQGNLTVTIGAHFQTIFQKVKQPVPRDVFVQYLVSSFLGLLIWWLDNDISYSAEQMNEFYRKLTEPTIQTLFRRQRAAVSE